MVKRTGMLGGFAEKVEGMTVSASDLDTLIGRLDLPAKVRLLTGAAAFTLAP